MRVKTYDFRTVRVNGGFLGRLQELNRTATIPAVYRQFERTGRIRALNEDWKEGDSEHPHIFWDSDDFKWIEAAAYTLFAHPDDALRAKIEAMIDSVEKHQAPDGYFNSYYQRFCPEERFTRRQDHELYCAGHMLEAAVAYAQATGSERLLAAADRYVDCIRRAFVTEKTAKFFTPGHEEIELALVRAYRYTGKKKYLELAAHFVNERGTHDEERNDAYHPDVPSNYNQSLFPAREQTEAAGHCVRACYFYTAMADLARELQDASLAAACRRIWEDITLRKMYVTGGIGSSAFGEEFSNPYDLPNGEAYTETCAGIALMFFAQSMLERETRAEYADVLERAFYNGVLSGVSLDGKSFFYENPLEITMRDHFRCSFGERRFPITQRVECFFCSCCPPNLARVIARFGEYVFGTENDTLYVNQFAEVSLEDGALRAGVRTNYPADGEVRVSAAGVKKIALRIPGWCASFTADAAYERVGGYAVFENAGEEITVNFDVRPFAVASRTEVGKDVNRLCVQAGPVVYCAESVDNGEDLHALTIGPDFSASVSYREEYGMNVLEVSGRRRKNVSERLYARAEEASEPVSIRMIPYRCFANRGESDMLVWLNRA